MRNGGRISAAIDVLTDVLNRHQPVKSAARDWGKRARYAGSKDRAFVSGLVLDALRKRNSIAHAMGDESPRGLILGALAHAWGWGIKEIDSAMDEEHAPGKLTLQERERLVHQADPGARRERAAADGEGLRGLADLDAVLPELVEHERRGLGIALRLGNDVGERRR